MHLIRQAGRTLGALFVLLFAATAFARAGIQANKTFTPNSVTLGGTSTVTVTLQNDSTSSSAAITAFSDDIGTSMTGHATLLSSPAPTTTCSGGTPTVAGQVLTMNNGTIPIAPNSSTLGSCTITFSVKGAIVGNGFNTIAAANVVTSLGSPTADVTQTLAVQAANVTATASSPGSVQMGGTNTVTYIVTNPASIPLTNVAFPITSNGASTYTVSNAATTCGGAFGLPAAGVTGTTTFSGLTIPASGTCSVTLTVTSAAAQTVNFILPASMVSDVQGATNTVGTSGQTVFVSGKPNITKSFSPTAIAQNGTSTLTITVQNVLTDKPLTQAAFSDILPAGLTLSSTPVANGNGYCGSPVLGGNGTGTLTFSGGTITTNKTCTITATVTTGSTVGSVTNTIPTTGTGSFTSVEANGSAAAATATLSTTGTGGGISITNAATPTSTGINTPIKLTFGFTSLAGGVFSGGTFAFNVPQTTLPMVAVTSGGAYTPTFTNCGSSSPAVAFGGTSGNTTVTGSNLALTAGGTCSVSFWIMFTATTPVSRTDIETLTGSNVTFSGTGGNVSPSSSPSVTLTEVATLSMTNYVASATGPLNQQVTVSGTINDISGTADTNAVAVFNLTANKVMLAPTPNFTFGGSCPAGLNASNITVAGNREQFTVMIGAINASCTIGYDVINESGVGAGSYTPGNATYSGTLTGGVAQSYTGQNNVSFASTTITVTKAFGPNQIQSGGNSTADITLSAPQAGSLARTQVNGVTFSDALPAGMTFSPTPNVTFTAGCQQTGQPAPAGAISGTTITFTNISLLTVGTVQTTCDAKFDVTSSVVGAPLNQLDAGSITSTSGTTNSQVAKASLTVNAGLGIAKTFVSPTLPIGGTDYVRFLVTNSATTAALSGGTLVDVMPSSLVLSSTTLGSIQAGDPALCGGSVGGPIGTGTLSLSGLAVAGEVGSTPAQCVVYVLVKASGTAASGNVTNTIAAGGLNAGGFSNQTSAAGSVTLTPPAAPILTKTVAPATIAPGGTSVLTITMANTATGKAFLSGVALTDSLPAGVTVAATPGASTTCTSATLTATAGATSVALAGGTLGANVTCKISVSVTAAAAGSYTNTIVAGTLTTTQGATNASDATATLTVASITLSKAFAPATISAGASSTLTITIPNGTTPLTGVSLTDTLPTGVTIAAAPNAATTCPSGSVTATPGGSSVALTGGTLAASATCTVTADVTGTTAATYTNTIAANALATTQTITNPAAATATLTIGLAGVALTKAFAPATIVAGDTSVLTISIPNTASGAVALTGVALTDTLPTGVTIAATPNAATTCTAGTATATAGGTSIALAGGTLAANATCTISVNVTATVAASYTNTIAASALSTTQGVSNTAPATPNAATTCPTGTVTAVAGGTSVALAAGTVAANATCTVTVTVTGTVAASYINTIGASALTTTQGVTNAAPATANLTINPDAVTLSKAFAPAAIVAGGTSHLTITIPNTAAGAVALTGMALTDTLPSGLTIAATPDAATTCPTGTVTAVAGGTSVALAAGTVAANATCTVTVDVTGTVSASYTNTISTSALTTSEGVSNAAPATAPLTITSAGITLSKVFVPAAIVEGGTSTLTITIPNTAPGAVALTAMALTDTLPTGVIIAATPNASTTCTPGGNVTAIGGGTSVALAGGTLAANATCTIVVQVGGTAIGSHVNTIATHALSTAETVSNQAPATATLDITAVPDVSLTKAFLPATVLQGSTSLLTITVSNTATSSVPLTGLALTDAYPAGLVNATTPAAATTCPAGTVTAIAGAATLALSGATLAANASCTITVNVDAPIGTYSNTVSSLTTTEGATNVAAATASLSVTAASAPTITNSYAPPSILPGGISTLTISIANTGTNAIALGNVALTDTLLAGVTIASVPNATTTCPSGAAAGSAGGSTLTLAGASLAAGTTCTLTVDVTSANVGAHTNTIAANALSDTQLLSNPAPASTTLTVGVAPALALTQAFAPPTIVAGTTSVLTLSLANAASGAVSLTGIALTDALPAGVVVAAMPNASTTCASGTLSAVAGATSFALSGGALAVNANCTLSITVVASTAGVFSNAIAAGALTSTQGATNAATTATLSVTAAIVPPLTLTKAFSPASIVSGGASTLTVTIANAGAGAIALTSLAFVDTLPAGVFIAAGPVAATTCSGGTVAAAAGGTTLTLATGTLAAGATCTVSVNVTSAVPGTYVDTSAIGAVGDTQNVSNPAIASAPLSVTGAPAVGLSQAFVPASISAGATSVLTLTLANTVAGAVPLTGIALADALPAGIVLAAAPNASTTCPAGTLTASAGSASFALSSATLGVGATCTITASVTAASAGAFTNSIAAGALTSTQGATNAAIAATLTVTAPIAPPLTLTKVFAPASIVSSGISLLTLTIANGASGAVPLTALALTDTLPAGVTIAAIPNAATTCGSGTLTSAAGSGTLALANGTLAAGATCTITVNVTSSAVGSHIDTSLIGTVQDTQNVSNVAAASATLNVTPAPALGLTQAFSPAAIAAGATSVLTLTFTNTAVGAIPLSAITFTDMLPAGVVLAATPGASTTCSAGALTVVAGAATFALSAATLAANATCTLVVTVTSNGAGTYSNSILAAAVSDAQGVTNAATKATLTVTAQVALRLNKTSDVAGAAVDSGQTIAYTVTIVNPGTTLVTGAKLTDALTNATLVPKSVTVGGVAAPDAVVTAGTPFGSIAAGATVTIRYRATVNADIQNGARVTNTATADSDQGCAGAACSGAAPADAVLSAPKVNVTLLIDGKMSAVVTIGQVVVYSATLTNVGGVSAQNVTLTDTLPVGVTPIPGSVTVSHGPSASSASRTRTLASAPSAIATTAVGQSVTASLGTIAAGSSATVEFRATITAPIVKVAANTVTVAATGIPTAVTSNVVVARMVAATLTVTKSASAVVAQIGDRVDYAVRIAAPAGIPFAQTTIVDQLPDYLSYAPGSARINGLASVPTVAGHTLTWTLPHLGAPITLTYATAIAAGVSNNATLNNLVTVSAAPLGGGPLGGGSASAVIQIAASTFGTCYPITGRVYDDVKGSGRFESGDTGLAGVSIVLDDGESVTTDAYGRYNLPCVRQGMHALRLDEKTLPDGSAPYADRAIDSERSIRRLVHGIFDDTILQDVNFAVTQKSP